MNLVRTNWSRSDAKLFQQFLETFRNDSRVERSKRIINTNMEMLAMLSIDIKKICKEIMKGNYLSFLNLNLDEYYENIVINGYLINMIKDFELQKLWLLKYLNAVDNWACCDLFSFKIASSNAEQYYQLSLLLVSSDKIFHRRMGLKILFSLLKEKNYLGKIFEIANSLTNEQEYYVNMINAWLVAECFIKFREETLAFLKTNKLNKFTINKSVQKCRDSFRVSKEDKDMLLKFKR